MSYKAKNIYYSLGVIAFIIGAFFVLTYALGYKVDISNRNITQTAMIIIQSDEANIYIDNKLVGFGRVVLRDLEPGHYKVKLTKTGYHDWQKQVDLLSGQAEIIDDDILFKNKISPAEYTEVSSDFLNSFADTQNLSDKNNEIYQNYEYVTRFAKEATGVCWYSDRRYIAFTYEGKLKIIQTNGTNEIALLDKNSASPVVFINSGRSVIYENNGKIYKADIR